MRTRGINRSVGIGAKLSLALVLLGASCVIAATSAGSSLPERPVRVQKVPADQAPASVARLIVTYKTPIRSASASGVTPASWS